MWSGRLLVKALKRYKQYYPNASLILQIGPKALETVKFSALEIARRVAEEYEPYIDYVLLDGSGGRGIPMEAGPLLEKIEVLKARCPNMALAVAGGLGPNTVDLAVPILRAYPDVSVDAQGKLRKEKMDPIDPDMCKDYMKKFVKLYKEVDGEK